MLVSFVCIVVSQYFYIWFFICFCLWFLFVIVFKRSFCMFQMFQLVDCEIIFGKLNMNIFCCYINFLGEMMCYCFVQFFLFFFVCCVVFLCVFSFGKVFFVILGILIYSMFCDQELISDVFDLLGLLYNDMNKIVVIF